MKHASAASIDYRQTLLQRLKDPAYAAEYLSACLDEDEKTFLVGLRDVADAHGGLRRLSKKARLNREHLFRMLSKSGNPKLHSVRELIAAVGLKLILQPA